MSARLYVEGAGHTKTQRTACRKAFGSFIEKAGAQGRMPRIVACGGRNDAYDSFKTAHAQGRGAAMLLVDAEGPVAAQGPWQHLQASDNWQPPPGATDDQCHLMVQVMESWFLANKSALASFYGQNFQTRTLPANANVEQISKDDVLDGLERATRSVSKGPYSKGKHGFEILATLDPAKVRRASTYADRLIRTLAP